MSQTFEERYKKLNDAQKKAVDTLDGPVLVVAGPGSGKTELLSIRVGNILRKGLSKPSNILLLTFTDTAAKNMRDRLESIMGTDAYRVAIYTFHGFCTDIIERYPEYFYEAHNFRPASDLLRNEILEDLFWKLPHGHKFGKRHPELGYTFLREVSSKIADIKRGGLKPARFRELVEENEEALEKLNALLEKHLPERIGKDAISSCTRLKDEMEKLNSSLGNAYARYLEEAIKYCEEDGKTQPLTAWKAKFTGKSGEGKRIFKDTSQVPKLLFLADMYEKYQANLFARGLYDFEDMILQVVGAFAKYIPLRTEIEEQYHYILVDEFQDTNKAQLALVKAISSHDVHEGRPNVCVVGDDDQAVYKFQGADISNIHTFKTLYKDVVTIVLTENYRSTARILDFARALILQGEERLERLYPDIRKDVTSKNTKLPEGRISQIAFATSEEEYAYIAAEVRALLDSGVEAKEIALIARKHKYLTGLLPSLDKLGIPYTYTRKENVFDELHVKEIVTLCRFLATVGAKEFERDDLLPEILAFPFWKLDRIEIWRVAEQAKNKNLSWFDAMLASKDEKIRNIATFLIELGVIAQTAPLEIVLDMLIGSKETRLPPESEYDDGMQEPHMPSLASGFYSPYKSYYFGEHALKDNPSVYIHFLSSLRVFMQALKEYKEGEMLRVHDVGSFVDRHISYGIALINETPFAHNENSVQILTSHKAKGLEFEYVFIVSANDKIWTGKGGSKKISFPKNLSLETTADNEDDFLRLFYVAVTRAKHTLYITHHASPLRFLSHENVPNHASQANAPISELLAESLQVHHVPPFAKDEKALLKKVVENYVLSPTHLNNFLDITRNGPILFLEQNLLRFPQAKNVSSVFGTAIHKAIEDAHLLFRESGKQAKLERLIESFNKELKRGRLLPTDEEKQRKRGEEVLARYYELKKGDIKKEHLVELNFKYQAVEVEGSLLTGKIDKVVENEDGSWSVIDFKTGQGPSSWEDDDMKEYMEIKLHNYRYQLMMYKLLVENSRDYSGKTVSRGTLEFVEEEDGGKIREISLPFDEQNSSELARFKKLVKAVYEKIVTLDFAIDIGKYEQSLAGILEFEEDLIAGRV